MQIAIEQNKRLVERRGGMCWIINPVRNDPNHVITEGKRQAEEHPFAQGSQIVPESVQALTILGYCGHIRWALSGIGLQEF